MKKNIVFALILLVTFVSCSKEDDTVEPEPKANLELLPLKTGNYWIYGIGWKITTNPAAISSTDTLRVVKEENGQFYLQSREQVIMPNGYYKNEPDGLYMNGSLQFKYPVELNESCGSMFMGETVDTAGNKASGFLFKNDYKYNAIDSCYYYFLLEFYPQSGTKITGYVSFKPGIGLINKDWVSIDLINDEFYNDFCGLISYHLE